ncbi:MAG: hypothetical protein ACYC6J_07045 [Coriobacteriia bacterium]
MADIHHDDDVGRGFNSTLGVILAILLVLAILVGGWWLFFREPVDVVPDSPTIEQDIDIENGGEETTPGP